jgi:hypothetical protein
VCNEVWARTAGGKRSGSAFKREIDNIHCGGGGGGGIAFIFQPDGLNQTIRLVAIVDNMTIKRMTVGFGLKQPGDGVAASLF